VSKFGTAGVVKGAGEIIKITGIKMMWAK